MARVALILDELFEDSEFQVPYDRVRDAGHEAVIHLTLTDDHPWAQAFVVIEARKL